MKLLKMRPCGIGRKIHGISRITDRPAPNDKDAMIMKSKQEGLTKKINKFMICEQTEEKKKFLPAAERTDHFWEKTNASKGDICHDLANTGGILPRITFTGSFKTNNYNKNSLKQVHEKDD